MTKPTKEKLPKLTKKRKQFADKVLDSDNATQAAREVFKITNDNYAKVKAHREMHKPEVIAYLEENAQTVASNIVHLALNAENEGVQLAAGKDVLDRAGYKPVEKSVSVNFQIPIENRQYVESVAQKAIEQMKHGEN